MQWTPEHNGPTEPGWYPVLMRYDGKVGIPMAARWDGSKWSHILITHYWPQAFETKDAAMACAEANPWTPT